MAAVKAWNLFVSHSWAYGDAYERLICLLDAAPGFSYRNYSVPRSHPVHNAPTRAALYSAIRARMSFCHVVIILAGKYATFSDWIQHEIAIAKDDFNKRVLAVRPWSSLQVSSVVAENADLLVSWSTRSIVSGIELLASEVGASRRHRAS